MRMYEEIKDKGDIEEKDMSSGANSKLKDIMKQSKPDPHVANDKGIKCGRFLCADYVSVSA